MLDARIPEPQLAPEDIFDLAERRRREDDAASSPRGNPPEREADAGEALAALMARPAEHAVVSAHSGDQLRLPRPWLDAQHFAKEAHRVIAICLVPLGDVALRSPQLLQHLTRSEAQRS